MAGGIPESIRLLHTGEEILREKALALIEGNARFSLHLDITVHMMDLADILRQFPTDNEDLKIVQVLGIRTFNAFASAIKLMLSGYSQKAALILRDILECTFLVDLFRTDRPAISRWRIADKQARRKEFSPVRVREVLDARDGFTTKKRAEMYSLFSELAGHPSMLSAAMLRPKGMDVHSGPFLDPTTLEAVLSEMGRLAVPEVLNVVKRQLARPRYRRRSGISIDLTVKMEQLVKNIVRPAPRGGEPNNWDSV